jgi:hypothetical protein
MTRVLLSLPFAVRFHELSPEDTLLAGCPENPGKLRRLQTQLLPSTGRTVGDTLQDWVDAGTPDVTVVNEADMAAIFEAAPTNLADYWKRWQRWASGGFSVELPY